MLKRGKSGFTLVELMVAVLIIAILMSFIYKLSGLGKDSTARSRTVARIQKLQNALSGFYAVYGSYPPVPLQGVSRNIYISVDKYGVQDMSNKNNRRLDDAGSGSNPSMWAQVQAALMAQPVGCIYPYPRGMNDFIKQISDMQKEFHNSNVEGFESDKFAQGYENASGNNVGGIFGSSINNASSEWDGKPRRLSPLWNDCQLFRYGLLSFLLPRYLFMMSGAPEFYETSSNGANQYEQWGGFNQLPCRVKDGSRYSGWIQIRNKIYGNDGSDRLDSNDKAEIEALPSQAVCRRWLPNLAGIVRGGKTFYGVDVSDGLGEGYALRVDNPNIPLYRANGLNYVLAEMTIDDGWGNPLYYYSEAPYQSYRLWSAGPDGKTFPPWVPLDTLTGEDRKTAAKWLADDIM